MAGSKKANLTETQLVGLGKGPYVKFVRNLNNPSSKSKPAFKHTRNWKAEQDAILNWRDTRKVT